MSRPGLELGYEDDAPSPPPLRDYRPGFGGHRPYTRLIAEWVAEAVGSERIVDVARPQLVLDDRLHDDVYFTVDLTALPAILGPERTAATAHEASAARAAHGDAGLLGGRGEELEHVTLEHASLANHGPTLHASLIAPRAAQFLAGGARRTLAQWDDGRSGCRSPLAPDGAGGRVRGSVPLSLRPKRDV